MKRKSVIIYPNTPCKFGLLPAVPFQNSWGLICQVVAQAPIVFLHGLVGSAYEVPSVARAQA